MESALPDDLFEELKKLTELNEHVKNNLILLNEKRNPKDIQHQVLFVSLARVGKYFDAYLILARNGYGEPAACLLRSIFEASLWMRWSLESKECAEKYFNASKSEAKRMLEKILSRNIVEAKNFPDGQNIKQILGKIKEKDKLPSWSCMANKVGLDDLYALIYPMLSAMSHGSLMFLGERFIEFQVSIDADYKNIKPFIPIANNLLRDCYLVCEQWILYKKVRPVPDYRQLITQ